MKSLGATEIELKTGTAGQFDVWVDGTLRYSRFATGRFPTEAEIDALAGRSA